MRARDSVSYGKHYSSSVLLTDHCQQCVSDVEEDKNDVIEQDCDENISCEQTYFSSKEKLVKFK